jgi:Kdo2-lipid IVA lauroyltransferase/acyltransferase
MTLTSPPTPTTPALPLEASEPEARQRQPRDVVLRHRVQYAALRGILGAIGTLGVRGGSNLGAQLGKLGYRPFGIRRRVVERQIAAAFPQWDSQRVTATAQAAYENLGRTTFESALLSRYDRQRLLGLFEEPQEWQLLERARREGRGAILVGGHLGNWELTGAYVAARGLDFEAVARQMENPLFDAYLTRNRNRLGMRIIYDGDAVRRVPRAVRAGAFVAFLMDQGAAGLASTWVPFFGRLAKTPRGPAVFALRLGVPVFFVTAIRQGDGRYRLGIEEIPIRETGDKTADVDRIVADYTATLERWVRKAPEQYFWHHRRWKHQQPGTPPELGDPLR